MRVNRVNEKSRFRCFYEEFIAARVTNSALRLDNLISIDYDFLDVIFHWNCVNLPIDHYSLSERIEACHFSSLRLSITQKTADRRKNNNGVNGVYSLQQAPHSLGTM